MRRRELGEAVGAWSIRHGMGPGGGTRRKSEVPGRPASMAPVKTCGDGGPRAMRACSAALRCSRLDSREEGRSAPQNDSLLLLRVAVSVRTQDYSTEDQRRRRCGQGRLMQRVVQCIYARCTGSGRARHDAAVRGFFQAVFGGKRARNIGVWGKRVCG